MSTIATSAPRIPLSDAKHRINTMSPSMRTSPSARSGKSPLPTLPIPKNETIVGDGTLNVRQANPTPQYKRISEIAEHDDASKRLSAASDSTNNSSATARKRKTHIGPWQLGQTIGKGGTSRVRKVRHAVTGETAVAKIIAKSVAEKARTLSLANLTREAESGDPGLMGPKAMPFGLEREIVIMKLLDHRNIVRLYDVWENRNELYLIMEYVEGCELFEYVAQRGRVDERDVIYMFRQIIAALLYCSRLKIHHRDLKPENILLDPHNLELKVVDFGYAALQPAGGRLTTPCGSPHYAAPEVIQGKHYDGSKSDIWSCGVILFVLLSGVPPFNFPVDSSGRQTEDKKLKGLFSEVLKGKYTMPTFFSTETQDLIRRIFVVDPIKRISIEDIWHHPLLHKYDRDFGIDAASTDINTWIGPYPKIDNWRPVTRKTIDREILRNLRVLWHSVPEKTVIEQICSPEPNQEKYFYNALLLYRQENYKMEMSGASKFTHSASDHRHVKPAPVIERPPSRVSHGSGRARKSHSRYSVTGNEHLYSRHSFFEKPSSEASYDPFRASRDPVIHGRTEQTNILVHDRGYGGNQSLLHPNASLRDPRLVSNRVDVLRRQSRRSSGYSSASGSWRSYNSRSSIRSGLGSTTHISVRPSSIHKRNVNFVHIRRNSTAGSSVKARHALGKSPLHDRSILASSSPRSLASIRVAKNNGGGLATEPTPSIKRNLRDIDKEARKVSAELQSICEEAFYRGSVSSSERTSITDKPNPYTDTPPSSVSNASTQRNGPRYYADKMLNANRPLPPTPHGEAGHGQLDETPHSYTTRELAQLRDRLAQKYAQHGASSQEELTEVLRQLDALTVIEAQLHAEGHRRIASAPYAANSHHTNEAMDHYLHVIPEEGRFADAEESNASAGASRVDCTGHTNVNTFRNPTRAVTSPPSIRYLQEQKNKDKSIRLVIPSSPPSPSPWAPLNTRKQSNDSSSNSDKMSIHVRRAATADGRTPSPILFGSANEGSTRQERFGLDDRIAWRNNRYERIVEEERVKRRNRAATNNGAGPLIAPASIYNTNPGFPAAKNGITRMKDRLFKPFKKSPLSYVNNGNIDDTTEDEDINSAGLSGDAFTQAASTSRPGLVVAPGPKRSKYPGFEDRSLLKKIFSFKPKQAYVAIKTNTKEAAETTLQLICEGSKYSGVLIDIQRVDTTAPYEIRVLADRNLQTPTTFAIEFFGIQDDNFKGKDEKFAITVCRFTFISGCDYRMAGLVRKFEAMIKVERFHWVVSDEKEAKAYKGALKKNRPVKVAAPKRERTRTMYQRRYADNQAYLASRRDNRI